MTNNRRTTIEEELRHELKDSLSLNIKIRGRLERARHDNVVMQKHLSIAATLVQDLLGLEEEE